MALDYFLGEEFDEEKEKRKKAKEVFKEFEGSVREATKKLISQLEEIGVMDEVAREGIINNVADMLAGIYDLLF